MSVKSGCQSQQNLRHAYNSLFTQRGTDKHGVLWHNSPMPCHG